jgi:hypothetical protein
MQNISKLVQQCLYKDCNVARMDREDYASLGYGKILAQASDLALVLHFLQCTHNTSDVLHSGTCNGK